MAGIRRSLVDASSTVEKAAEIKAEKQKEETGALKQLKPGEPGYRPERRRGKVPVTTYVQPETSKQLRLYCINNDVYQHDVLIVAINDFFRKNGLPVFDSEVSEQD